METLFLGLIIFFLVHLVPAKPTLHQALRRKLGKKGFKICFALISLVGFTFIIIGKGEAPFVTLYEPPEWGKNVAALQMLLALICLVSFKMKSSITTVTAHPMLWGISFWSAGHLLVNGDQASILLFGSFLIYSIFAMVSTNLRGAKPSQQRISLIQNGLMLVVASSLYIVLMFSHTLIAGVSIMQ